MTNNEPVIKVRKLKIAFGSKVVLDEIDLDLYPGETLAVIGPSGTGKSTVLKVMTGLLKPTSGSVIIQGQETNGFDESQWDELRKHMGVVFQYSALFDFLTVGENVAFGLRRHFNLS
jgi:phospholipid/cholesterol/gamma-HCH transport system ATP-binding protein